MYPTEENKANGWGAGGESLFPVNEMMDVAWRTLGTAAAAWPASVPSEDRDSWITPAMGCTVL